MSTGPLLPIALDRSRPLGRQLETRLRETIRAGAAPAGTRLPSTRALAADLGVSRGVVVAAYEQLAAEGYVIVRRGAAPEVALLPQTEARPVGPDVPVAGVTHNLRPDLPDLSLFPRADWAKATRAVLGRVADTDLAYGEPFGAAELREALAPFLARTRGVVADAGRVGVHAGSTQGLSVLVQALRDAGARRIGVEDPGHRWRTATIAATGIEVVPVPEIDTALLRGLDAVVVSPEHRFPLGTSMAPAQRRALVEWAVAEDALVIEHDYDGHFRYDRSPAGALQALAPEHVAYVGTASALLAPTLRLGWSVLPERWVVPVAGRMALHTFATNRITQLTLAELLARGWLDRHLRRARSLYRERYRRACRLLGVQSQPQGLFVHVPCEADLGELQAKGFALDDVRRNSIGDHPQGLAVGFAGAGERSLRALAKMVQ